jgi:hypothetical protein
MLCENYKLLFETVHILREAWCLIVVLLWSANSPPIASQALSAAAPNVLAFTGWGWQNQLLVAKAKPPTAPKLMPNCLRPTVAAAQLLLLLSTLLPQVSWSSTNLLPAACGSCKISCSCCEGMMELWHLPASLKD